MSMSEEQQEQSLATMRAMKKALDEGLITQDDFDVVKHAFLKANQLKAGLDAGFIREEDYDRIRDSFLHSLDFATSLPSSNGLAPSAPAAAVRAGPPPPRTASNLSLASAGAAPVARFNTPPRSSSVGGALLAQGTAAQVPFPGAPPLLQQQNSTGGSSNGGNGGTGTVDIPADLSRFQRGPSAVGKKSMAGIGLSDQAVAIFNCIKTKSAHKWVTYKIDDGGHEVIIDVLGAQNATFDEFVGALPATFSRYGVYDYAYTNADTGSTVNKLVFIHWAPDSSTTRSKMMYASTKDFFKGFLDGIGAEMQATEVSELNLDEMRERVGQAITRK